MSHLKTILSHDWILPLLRLRIFFYVFQFSQLAISWIRKISASSWVWKDEKGNWINKEEKRHKIKWHYLKLVFLPCLEKSTTCHSSGGIAQLSVFSWKEIILRPKRSIFCFLWTLFSISLVSRRRRLIFSNPNKRYREMWLKIVENRDVFLTISISRL